MKMPDTARFTDINALIARIERMTEQDGKDFAEKVNKALRRNRKGVHENMPLKDMDADIYSAADKMYRAYHIANYTDEQNARRTWEYLQKKAITRIRRFHDYSETAPITIGRWIDGEFAFIYLGNPQKGLVIPEPMRYLQKITGEDYSEVSPANLSLSLTGSKESSDPPFALRDSTSLKDISAKNISAIRDSVKDKLRDLRAEAKNVEYARTGELAKMQAEIERMQNEMMEKKSALMAELDAKKAKMEAQMELLNNQIYLLDSQIYSILCYNGQTVKFTKLLSGKNAEDTEPIIIYQKLRFLDEELGKLASLYTIQWNELDMFEDLLKYSPVARDTFAPTPRCIQLIRLSRTGKELGRYRPDDGLPSNMLEEYDYFHGSTVGIIIRNGENIYLGWTDEERVHIEDDLLVDFSKTIVLPEEETKESLWRSEKDKEKLQKANAKKFIDGYISRQFVFNVLQGIVDHSDILSLPAGVNLGQQSEYVVYSLADGALPDNRFGSFGDIIKKCNSDPRVGDMLLILQGLSPEYNSRDGRYQTWNNPRGRGDKNLTHDASVDDCALYPLNHIDIDPPVKFLTYKTEASDISYKIKLSHQLIETEREIYFQSIYLKYRDKTKEDLIAMSVEVPDVDGKLRRILPPEDNARDFAIYETDPQLHISVSAQKSESRWNGTDARANFELYSHEYINLTYLNSVWLEYAITTQKLDGWSIGGKAVLFSHGIRYLKTALDYIRKREAEEKALIDAVDPTICEDANWPLQLTEWKMANKIHKITAYQAKRFAKATKEGKV